MRPYKSDETQGGQMNCAHAPEYRCENCGGPKHSAGGEGAGVLAGLDPFRPAHTNWLDPENVRGALHPNDWTDLVTGQMSVGLCVLEAIAALPEPDAACAAIASEVGLEFDCESKEPCGWELDSKVHLDHGKKYCHEYIEPLAHRIWVIAHIVCGKEEADVQRKD